MSWEDFPYFGNNFSKSIYPILYYFVELSLKTLS